MTTEQERAFDKVVEKELAKQQEAGTWTSTFNEETLTKALDGLRDWETLTGKERMERVEADGRGKKLYKMASKFGVVQLPGGAADAEPELALVERNKAGKIPALEECRQIVPVEKWFEVLRSTHDESGHVKVKGMEKVLNAKFARIPRWAVEVRTRAHRRWAC